MASLARREEGGHFHGDQRAHVAGASRARRDRLVKRGGGEWGWWGQRVAPPPPPVGTLARASCRPGQYVPTRPTGGNSRNPPQRAATKNALRLATMPATAGRVRMPANNRMQTSASLNTHGIWQNAIGCEPA